MTTHRIHAKPRNYPPIVLTDEDAAMQSKPADHAQWRTVEELQRMGWRYVERDASGRRITMKRRNGPDDSQLAVVYPDGHAIHY